MLQDCLEDNVRCDVMAAMDPEVNTGFLSGKAFIQITLPPHDFRISVKSASSQRNTWYSFVW
jgi:hypothetical protein